jgi:hypothetical protein
VQIHTDRAGEPMLGSKAVNCVAQAVHVADTIRASKKAR